MKRKMIPLNLFLDLLLFVCFLLSFLFDMTGLNWHQLVGILVAALSLVHLLLHWEWVRNAVTRFTHLPSRPLVYAILDFSLAVGFIGIIFTGLIISTWFNLTLSDYSAWSDVHTAFALETLLVLGIKICVHWRWVVNSLKNLGLHKTPQRLSTNSVSLPNVAKSLAQSPTAKTLSRRDFLAVMGVVGITSYLAVHSVLKSENVSTSEQAATVNPETNTSVESAANIEQNEFAATQFYEDNPTATAAPTQAVIQPTQQSVTTSCIIRCNRGCSYPGACHRYVDTNGNNRCDNSECI